jgi:hypothetical protein
MSEEEGGQDCVQQNVEEVKEVLSQQINTVQLSKKPSFKSSKNSVASNTCYIKFVLKI